MRGQMPPAGWHRRACPAKDNWTGPRLDGPTADSLRLAAGPDARLQPPCGDERLRESVGEPLSHVADEGLEAVLDSLPGEGWRGAVAALDRRLLVVGVPVLLELRLQGLE